jgi:hypothetical protein
MTVHLLSSGQLVLASVQGGVFLLDKPSCRVFEVFVVVE